MAKSKGVSSKTHTKQQFNDYANQHNPNNKAFASDMHNRETIAKNAKRSRDLFFC